MKNYYLLIAICLCLGISACSSKTPKEKEGTQSDAEKAEKVWKNYFVGNILFEDKAPPE